MAIRDTLTGIGKRAVQGILGSNLRRVAGGFASLIGGPNRTASGDFEGINRKKTATNMLSFPIDVANADPATGGNHGHYIMFFINEQQNAKLKFDNTSKSLGTLIGVDNLFKEAKKRGFGTLEKVVDSVTGKVKPKPVGSENYMSYFFKPDGTSTEAASKIINDKLKTGDINKKPQGTKENSNQTISVDRAPTRRLNSVITMFMPADVKVNYKTNFSDQQIGTGTALVSKTFGEVARTGESPSTEQIMSAAGDLATQVGRNALVDILSVAPIFEGSKEAIEIGMGTALTDRMEMAFKGLDKRKFTYTFKMMPRSQDEANEIKKIVDMFKFHMLPEFTGSTSRGMMMNYPSTFDIKYMYQNQENNYLNKVSECYLESMEVDYGGDRYKTFEGNDVGAPPLETTITLQFGEIELITRERAAEGF